MKNIAIVTAVLLTCMGLLAWGQGTSQLPSGSAAGSGGGGGAITAPLGAGTSAGAVRVTSASDDPLIAAVNSSIPPGAYAIGSVQTQVLGSNYETIAASQTAQVMGATGAAGDYLSHCVVYPTSTSPGVLTVFDNTSTAGNNVIAFPSVATSTSNLVPFAVPVGAVSVNGPWKVTTGANMVVTCYGKFT